MHGLFNALGALFIFIAIIHALWVDAYSWKLTNISIVKNCLIVTAVALFGMFLITR